MPAEFARVGDLVVDAYRTLGDPAYEPYEAVIRDVAGRVADGVVLVAELESRIVGSVTFAPPGSSMSEGDDPAAATIRLLGVDETARGQGVGEALVRACLDLATAAGLSRVRLGTRPSMHAAHRLYERLGFRRDPVRDFWPTPTIQLLAYVLDIDTGSEQRDAAAGSGQRATQPPST